MYDTLAIMIIKYEIGFKSHKHDYELINSSVVVRAWLHVL